MSLENRQKAVQIIDKGIKSQHSANYILNQLLRAGFLNDKVTVHAHELKDEMDKAVFKCRIHGDEDVPDEDSD